MKRLLFVGCCLCLSLPVFAQHLAAAAERYLSTLDSAQRIKTLYPFDSEERFNFHYFPINDRKGLPLDEMSAAQQSAAFELMRTSVSNTTIRKVREIIALEEVLKELEQRKPEDHFRDPGKYYLAVFGIPSDSTIWGWRFEGHHVSFHFSAADNKLVSGTPAFLGANPAVVPSGPHKGQEVLKEERVWAFDLLHHLSAAQLSKALIDTAAPGEIITGISRKAMISHPQGILYTELSKLQQQQLLKLISLYVHRYKSDFAANMLSEIQKAGLDSLRFAWAGHTQPGIGHPHYYRIQGPTIIIEYDNTQNNANHVHTVARDLLHDYGGDLLLEHYHSGHHH